VVDPTPDPDDGVELTLTIVVKWGDKSNKTSEKIAKNTIICLNFSGGLLGIQKKDVWSPIIALSTTTSRGDGITYSYVSCKIDDEIKTSNVEFSMLKDTTITITYKISSCDVNFKLVENTTMYFNGDKAISDRVEYVKPDTQINIKHVLKDSSYGNCSTQTYSWGSYKYIYVADLGYKFKDPWTGYRKTTNSSITISPEVELAQCTVTIAELGEYADMATLTISTPDEEDVSTTEPFAVEMGTIINFSASMDENGIFTYTYVFVYNETTIKTATYVMRDALYVMQFKLDENCKREKLLNSLNGTGYVEQYTINGITTLTISPTFGLRQYFGGLG